MAAFYRNPLRVYLVLAILSVIGVVSAWHLPISLFPNSSKPEVSTCFDTDLMPEAFLRSYGATFESQLRAIRRGSLEVETVTATYSPGDVCFDVAFKWGGDPTEAMREVQILADSLKARLPHDARFWVWIRNSDSGFLALSFFSERRSLDEVYHILEPVLTPKVSEVGEADRAYLYNPQQKQVQIELKPEALASFQLLPADVSRAILRNFDAYAGGSLTVGTSKVRIDFPRAVEKFAQFESIPIPTREGRSVLLGDLARLDWTVPTDSARVFKTSGASSVILHVTPKAGGNVKAMAEEVRRVVDEVMTTLPEDIQYQELVDPSHFIRSAVNNVAKEVALAAILAVIVLFVFVGHFRNVATAAIEIPLSIVLAFVLMRIAGMNLNLISLGGLALSAGMNVDASVVVMENIFRHFERFKGRVLSFEERFQVIVAAVREVRFAVIASTISSLVVFAPLAFTSELTYAILGDLAKAVVFSHGFSVVVALILVPTIRLHLLSRGPVVEKTSVFENGLKWLESKYALGLEAFLSRRALKLGVYAGLVVLVVVLTAFVVPKLPREIIGRPDTDWLIVGINREGNTLTRQMEGQTEAIEHQILEKFGDEIHYTFTQINRVNSAQIMLRLKDKSKMDDLWKKLEADFTSTPDTRYFVDNWNPAEMPLPNPPDFEVRLQGKDVESVAESARDLVTQLREQKLFAQVQVWPSPWKEEGIVVRPRADQWPLLASSGFSMSLSELSDLARVATVGRRITSVQLDDESTDVFVKFPEQYLNSKEQFEAIPIGLGAQVIPLKAIAEVYREGGRESIRRENGQEFFLVRARGEKGEQMKTDESVRTAEELVKNWPPPTTFVIEDAKRELTTALHQLLTALGLSIGLIFLTMVFQFGSLMNSLLVLIAVPLGLVGVILSLWIFKSTLSLNSMLGMILLNGLAVANSIILVDFLNRAVKKSASIREAALNVARGRLRPILMTSMTTGCGMFPIALGLGEGGKILQPLGIAVVGGLGFSTLTTLFIVPALQVSWLEWQSKRQKRQEHDKVVKIPAGGLSLSMVGLLTVLLGTPTSTMAAEKMTFEEAWQKAMERDLRLKDQEIQIDSSHHRVRQRRGVFFPSLSFELSELRTGDEIDNLSSRRQTALLQGRMNLFRFGADRSGLKAALRDQEHEREKLSLIRQDVELDVARLLFQLIAREKQRHIIEQIVSLRSESLRIARERYAKGLLAQQEVDKIAIELENARSRLIDAKSTESEARQDLAVALGPGEVEVDHWPWKSSLMLGQKLEKSGFNLVNLPRWRARLAEVEAERDRLLESDYDRWPSLDLTAQYGNEDLSSPGRRDWLAKLSLSMPIFDQWRGSTNYRLQADRLRLTELKLESIKREAPAKVKSLKHNHRAARESALTRERTAELTQKLYADNLKRFQMGRASANDLALDQSRLLESELLAVEGWNKAHLTFVELCHALGGFARAEGQCNQTDAADGTHWTDGRPAE